MSVQCDLRNCKRLFQRCPRLRVYEQLKEKAALAYESSSKVQRYTRSILSQLELYVGGIKHGMPPWNIELRAPEFLELSSTADSALVALIVEIEQWEVSFASADLFRWAFGSASRDIGEAFDKLFNAVVPVLPTDKRPPEQGAFPQPPVSEQQLEAVGLLAKSYLYECDELHCYLHDLIVEAQNELVSPLFNRRVAIREPLDVRHKVITESQRHALLKYFKEDSAVGVAMAEARARVVARLSETNPPRAAAPE